MGGFWVGICKIPEREQRGTKLSRKTSGLIRGSFGLPRPSHNLLSSLALFLIRFPDKNRNKFPAITADFRAAKNSRVMAKKNKRKSKPPPPPGKKRDSIKASPLEVLEVEGGWIKREPTVERVVEETEVEKEAGGVGVVDEGVIEEETVERVSFGEYRVVIFSFS